MKKIFAFIFLVSLLAMHPLQSNANSYNTLPEHKNVPLDKTFTISLNQKVDIHSLDEANIYVKDQKNNIVSGIFVALEEPSQKKIIVRAPAEGYQANSRYTLYIENGLESLKGQRLLQETKMSFTTANYEAAHFEPRNNSLNDVVLTKKATRLTEPQMNALIEGEEENQHFVFNGPNASSIAQMKRGAILIFPATEKSPTGFAKKIESIAAHGQRVEIHTSEPTFDEVIERLDISKEVNISTDDFKLSKDVEQLAVASIVAKDVHKKTFKNKDGSTATVQFKDKKDSAGIIVGTVVQFDNFKFDILKTGDYTPLNGTMTFIRPVVTLDAMDEYAHYLQFTAGLHLDIDQSISIKNTINHEPKRVPIPIEIPVKFAGAVGATINPYLEFDISGEIKFGFHVGFESNMNIGLKRADEGWEGFNNSTVNPVTSLANLSGSIDGRLSIGTALQVEVLQFSLAGLEAALFADVNIDGQFSPTNICYSANAKAGIYFGGFVGDHKKALARIKVIDLSKDLLNSMKCEMQSIASENLSIKAGQSKQLTVTSTDLKGNQQALTLPNRAVSFKSHHENVVVTNNGHVHVDEKAEKNQAIKVTITYQNIIGPPLTKDVIITVLERDANAPITKPDLEEVAPTPVNKTYTIQPWKLSFNLPDDLKHYTIKESYGEYHIYKGDAIMVYILRYPKNSDPSFRGFWSYLGTKGDYSYYVRSGFNIFLDDENSPHNAEQAKTFNSIVESKKFIK